MQLAVACTYMPIVRYSRARFDPVHSFTSTGTASLYLVVNSRFFSQQLSRMGFTVRTVYSSAYQTKSRVGHVKSQNLDMSFVEPYILLMQSISSDQANRSNTRAQRIPCLLYCPLFDSNVLITWPCAQVSTYLTDFRILACMV